MFSDREKWFFIAWRRRETISYWKVFNDDMKYTPIKKSEIMDGVERTEKTKYYFTRIMNKWRIQKEFNAYKAKSVESWNTLSAFFFFVFHRKKNILKTISLPAWVIRFKQAFSSNQFWIFTLENSILVPFMFSKSNIPVKLYKFLMSVRLFVRSEFSFSEFSWGKYQYLLLTPNFIIKWSIIEQHGLFICQ